MPTISGERLQYLESVRGYQNVAAIRPTFLEAPSEPAVQSKRPMTGRHVAA
jgi:hypothetical protein